MNSSNEMLYTHFSEIAYVIAVAIGVCQQTLRAAIVKTTSQIRVHSISTSVTFVRTNIYFSQNRISLKLALHTGSHVHEVICFHFINLHCTELQSL